MMQKRMSMKLQQKPVLTQSLRQLVELLALNKLELRDEINQKLEENPVLELASDADQTAAAGDDAAPETAADEPADEAANALDDIDFEKFYEDYLDATPRNAPSEVIERPSFELFLSSPTTLNDHLLWQLGMSAVDEAVNRAAEFIIGNLSDNTHLTMSLEEVAESTEVDSSVAEKALRLVQEFDPLGVAARDLRECLLIQLRAIEGENCLAFDILSDHFELLERADTARIAASMRASERDVEQAIAMIRALDPQPGQQYQQAQNRYVEPDVYFVKTAEGFRVVLNEEDLPDLRINRSYRRLLERGKSDKDVRNYVKERYSSALQLLRNIEQRRQTIRRTCEAIVRRQTDFLANGLEHLRPMMIKDVAEEIGVHPSTVSRAVANKYAHSPHGVYELRFFFWEGVQGPSGSSMPLILLKRKVKRMIEAEDPKKPLTDDKLSEMLKEDGIHVTRRTVAKYREDLGVPSTHKRRRKG